LGYDSTFARFSSASDSPISPKNWLGSTFDLTACRTKETTGFDVARVTAT
jgi:hypothetical protein